MEELYRSFRGMPVVGHGKVSPRFLFLCRRKTTNLIDNEIHVTAETISVGCLVKRIMLHVGDWNVWNAASLLRDVSRLVLSAKNLTKPLLLLTAFIFS